MSRESRRISINQKNRMPSLSNQQKKVVEARVLEAMPSLMFRVELSPEKQIIAYLAGKMRVHYIKVLPGDRVLVELSPDGLKGRIIRRL